MNDSDGKLLELHMQQDKEQFERLSAKLDTLLEAHAKQRGFVAGFSAAFSLLVTTLVGLLVYIWQRHFGG